MNLNSQIPAKAAAVTPSDTTRFAAACLYVGGAGTLVVEPEGQSSTVTFTMQAGTYLMLRCTRVLAASTATGIVALS